MSRGLRRSGLVEHELGAGEDPSALRPAPSTPARPASVGWLHLTDLHPGMSGTTNLASDVHG
ncbi:hypothetical protein [Sorangium cellulosum]|uniref:hypothetical protein n=1 Tax=Sorangium cellulosum TaxID=56 RepID=UPI000CF57DE8|nr:hypothetical protein [Sorangium cellulosum]